MIRVFCGLFLCVAVPALAQSVEVADGNWAGIPQVAPADPSVIMSDRSMMRIEKLVQAGKCPTIGRRDRIRMNAQFIVQFGSAGEPQRIVVKRLGCPEVESILGGVILARLKGGYYRPTGQNQAGWYRSAIEYNLN